MLHGVVPPRPPRSLPHDHRMWAVIGVYQGLEHNELFARADGAASKPSIASPWPPAT